METVTEKRPLSNRQRRMARMGKAKAVVRNDMPEIVRPQTLVTRAVIEPENLRWFAMCVQSQKEERIVQVMDLCGIPAAIPTIPRHRVRRGKVLRWRSPICGGLVMVGFPGAAPINWHELTRFSLVHGFIKEAGSPRQIPWSASFEEDGNIKRGGVQTLLTDLEAVRVGAAKYMRMHPAYEAGDVVRIEDGPFAGHTGAVEHSTNLSVRVLLTLFGRANPITMPIGDVVRAA
jgi:transcription antitermination factor NusG